MATVAQREIRVLTAKKESLYGILQALLDLSKQLNEPQCLQRFNILYRSINVTRTDLLAVIDEIAIRNAAVDEKFIPDFAVLRTIDEICCHIHATAEKLKRSPGEGTVPAEDLERSRPKLPTVELPEFSGDIREWEIFYSMFKSLIHDNTRLTPGDKVHYLVGRLKGPALGICSGLSPTGENYNIIWKALVDKYQDKRLLASSYLDQILNTKILQGESSKNLTLFLERFDSAVRALKKLDVADLADFILLHQALTKLDPETSKLFEMSVRDNSFPSYDDLIKFVKEQTKILSRNQNAVHNKLGNLDSKSRGLKSFVVSNDNSGRGYQTQSVKGKDCIYCHKGLHYVGRCEKFKRLSPAKRYETVRANNWCYNCLASSHGVRNCQTERTCFECGKRHHILLHRGNPVGDRPSENVLGPSTETRNTPEIPETSPRASASASQEGTNSFCSTMINNNPQNGSSVLLSTAVVNVVNSPLKGSTVRFLIDSGSQANLLTVKCCKRLGIKVRKFHSSIQGLGRNPHPVRGVAELIISSRHDPNIRYPVRALLVDEITDDELPKRNIDTKLFGHLSGIPLADDSYYKPHGIEGILGAELFPSLMGSVRLFGTLGTPTAIETTLGYVVMGKVSEINPTSSSYTFFTLTVEPSLETLMNKFWELEEVPKVAQIQPEELECEQMYLNTYSRDDTGRFKVALPFKRSVNNLGESKATAQARLLTLERKLANSPKLRLEYNRVMQDFMDQGHMRQVFSGTLDNSGYYIPHHAVFKPDSTSTPVRVVFDASASCDNDVSLNDLLYSGPKLQTDIFTLLINFRLYEFALTADIRQMFRQISIIDDHRKFQRLLWRFDSDNQIGVFELTTVAFGVKSSPYLALRTVKQLISEEGQNYPLAATVVSRDLYMDDLVSSVASLEQARQLYQEATDLFAAGKFELTKWSTNNGSLWQQIPVERRSTKEVTFESDMKILGMRWNPESDTLTFNLSIPESKCSKRLVLSAVARCYDPIGLIAPFILYLKLLVKELWQLKLGWDDDPPPDFVQMWVRVRNEWLELRNFHISRYLGAREGVPAMIIAFADASNVGYGAVVYLRTLAADGNITVNLIGAKSKVSPFKCVTIPRLELCAALLLSKLVKHITEVYGQRLVISNIWAFSDSTTVLQWLNSSYLKDVFVANRVAQIRDNLPNAHWRHVEGSNNIADCLSRGLTPSQLVRHPFWISGPPWLRDSDNKWPVSRVSEKIEIEKDEVLLVRASETECHPLYDLIVRCSSWSTLLRTTVWILRFLKLVPLGKFITASDLLKAELRLVQLVQWKHFKSDIQLLAKGKPCSWKLRKLRPFLKDGLIRVGGRLAHALVGFDQRHPFLLPSKDPFVTRLVDYYHQRNLHTGPHLLEALIRQRYWLIAGRNLIRSRVHACNRCFRWRPRTMTPLMADLPAHRVQQAKVFVHTGLDYLGPVNITLGRKRGAQTHKAYVCLFICMSVKAVHLELVSSLSTNHFLQALQRFLARRGPCEVLYSDRGTNFIGARNKLSELYTFLNSQSYKDTFQTELALKGIQWKFNPPASPHMGGIWESNVKSVKNHIHRVVGEQLLTYEEFATFLTQVEALLNSRPLCQLSSDPSAPTMLTPAHFLTLSPLHHLPTEDVTDIKISKLDRFQLVDRMVQDFWKRWHLEYLSTLQRRDKWDKDSPDIGVGTVVLLKLDNSQPLHWPLGIISEVHPGKDKIIRVVTVKTNRGSFMRPVVKVCPLPTQ